MILSLKPTSWTKLSGRLKTNFACCIKVTESCARSQQNELQLEPGINTQSERGCGSQGNSRRKCCWENKTQNQVHSVSFLSATSIGQGVLLRWCIFLQIMPQFVVQFLINASHLFLARSTGKEFALKIIDKAKCCGKVAYINLHV